MNLDEVDAALADWKARRQRIDDNLVALEVDPTCMLLEQAQGAGLEGATRDRAVPALAAMRELFAQRSLLDDVIDQATKLRAAINRLWPGDSLKEIDRLLHGPSIDLPPVETPLARRGLLDAAETKSSISPDQLLGAMMRAFGEARDAVAAVGEAWNRLTPEVHAARAEISRLSKEAASLSARDASSTLVAIGADLDAIETRIARDPLGANVTLTEGVTSRLATLASQLADLDATRARVAIDHQRAQGTMRDLRAAHERSAASRLACEQQIEAPDLPAAVDPARIDGLAQWLATLDSTVAGGKWSAASVGLTRWEAAAAEALGDERAVETTCAGLVGRRDDLAGRLMARRQQARTLAARGRVHDPGLDDLAAEADALLRTTPCPLSEAERLVADFEARLHPR